jgi:hypothetical protein
MKKILLLILLFHFTYSYSQTYYQFPTSNTTWYETYHDQYGSLTNYSYLLLNSDTLINGKNYNNLFKPNSFWPYDTINIGCIREDSLKQIFFYNYSTQNEYLLYDFSKNIGDTIFYGTPSVYTFEKLLITNIDTVLIGNNYRRRFYTNYSTTTFGHEVWIEGIGSYRDLLSPVKRWPTCVCSWELNCIEENDSMYCLPGLFNSINNNISVSSNKIKISPNPFNATTEISFDKFCKTVDIEVYNVQGKLIKQSEFVNCKKKQFSRIGLENGLYFLKVILDKNIINTEKIILTD